MKVRVWALVWIFIAALHVGAFAVEERHELKGKVTGFLKKDGSPYLVTETIVVPKGAALLIEAGVELKFLPGTGIDVRGGSFAVSGERNEPVTFTSAEEGMFWNGISITGANSSEAQFLNVKNARYGFAVESGSLDLWNVNINTSTYSDGVGVYVKNGDVSVHWGQFQGLVMGAWAAKNAKLVLENCGLSMNQFAVTASEKSNVEIQNSILSRNHFALYDFGNNSINIRKSLIKDNEVGILARDMPTDAMKAALSNNKVNLQNGVKAHLNELANEPENPYADAAAYTAKNSNVLQKDSWSVSGSVGLDLGYHYVQMRHNHEGEPYISGNDTVDVDDRYINYFQVPGFFANWNANVVMESPTGQTFEVATDFSSDEWNRFKVHSVQAVYTDDLQRIALGDVYVSAGDIYLNGINAFGGSYDLSLFKNAANNPLFEGSAFAGEIHAPKHLGDKNDDIYQDYIDDGEAEAQQVFVGGKVRWNMHRRFNGTLGFLGSRSFLEDPILRDGMSENTNTANPLISSHTFFADGNWLSFPGDIKLNGQVAVGAADTTNSAAIHAVNQVFAEAGLDASNFSLLNRLMKNPSSVGSMSMEQLESIFGENSMKTASEMRAELRELLAEAAEVAKNYKTRDERPSHADFWNYKNWAVAGSYEWSNANTFIEGYFRYVGRGYYSIGSPDLLQNTRKYGGNFRQKISDFWKFSFGYELNVEHAADEGTGYNIFGLGEGTHWGLTGMDDDWQKEHELDANRSLYIHDAYIGNEFKINEKVSLALKYSVDYRTRSTAQRLYATYAANSGIYEDAWFKVRSGKSTLDVISENDTLKVDSARWAKYYELSDEDFLASQFEENLLKHTVELNAVFKLPKNVLRLGGVWVYRTDLSKFGNDDLLDGFDFSNETFGILGYYFHGGDFFEQRYPISLTTNLDGFRNMIAVTPRYKIYNRDEMSELEWSVADNMTIPMMDNFMELSLAGGVRQNFLFREVDGENDDEMELDVSGSASLRIHHTSSLYTDWTVGTVMNYRPDNRADEYKDLYLIASLNYSF